MQIKRLLDDREVRVDDRLFDAQGRSYGFLVHSGGELVVAAEDGRPIWLTLTAVRPMDYTGVKYGIVILACIGAA